jgi:hypothetical protein
MKRSVNTMQQRILVLLAAAGWLLSGPAQATQPRTYFVPLPEGDMFAKMDEIDNAATQPMFSLVSMSIESSGTTITYDHWENGYGDAQCTTGFTDHCTQVWGDGNIANGCAPLIQRRGSTGAPIAGPCAVNGPAGDDRLEVGDTVLTFAKVPVPRVQTGTCTLTLGTSDVATAQRYCFDGRDRIDTNFPIGVTKLAYPNVPGSLFAGGTEVAAANGFVNSTDAAPYFVAPVGENSTDNLEMFQNTSIWLQAGPTGATYAVTEPGNASPCSGTTLSLTQGQSVVINDQDGDDVDTGDIEQGDRVWICSGSAQAHLITGDTGSDWEMRWYQLLPPRLWARSYLAPVGTLNNNPSSVTTGAGCTRVWLYNDAPGPASITVTQTGGSGTVNYTVGSRIALRTAPLNNNAARYTSNSDFVAISTTDCQGGRIFDWGYPLLPANLLTTQVIAPFARGCTGDCSDTDGANPNSRSPLWVSTLATDARCVYVDYDGVGAACTGTPPPANPGTVGECTSATFVTGNVGVFRVTANQSLRIFDDQTPCTTGSGPTPGAATGNNGRQCDNNMTGAKVFTCDGTRIAAAWGQDPARSGLNDDDAFDLGTVVFPRGVGGLVCNSKETETQIANNIQVDSTGTLSERTIKYRISISNTGDPLANPPNPSFPRANLSLSDTFTSGLVEAGDVAGDNDADPNDPNYPYCLNASPNNAFIDKLAGDTDDFLEPGETWVWQCAVASQSGSLAPVVNVAFIRDSVTSTESSTCSASVTPFEPTLAILSGARAYASADGVQVEWETGIEAQTLGFHVERQDPGSDDFVRLTWDMLPAVLRGQGGRYRFLDQGAPGGEATYRLIEVEIDGNERVIGTFGLSEDMASESVPRAAPNGGAWTGAAHGARAWNGAAPARRDRNGFNAEERQPSEKAVERAKRAREAKADARESLRRLQEGAR